MLPAVLVAAAFGIAIANVRPEWLWSSIVVFVASAAIVAFAPIPAVWNERTYLACWIVIVACGAGVHLSNALRARVMVVLALAAGATGGAVAGAANAHAIVASLSLIATTTSLASRAVARRVPLAPKVVSSWLIAVALLAATLQMLPVTPGYLPDHLE
jgi:hypothetical protein